MIKSMSHAEDVQARRAAYKGPIVQQVIDGKIMKVRMRRTGYARKVLQFISGNCPQKSGEYQLIKDSLPVNWKKYDVIEVLGDAVTARETKNAEQKEVAEV